jgi:hypothetical protein
MLGPQAYLCEVAVRNELMGRATRSSMEQERMNRALKRLADHDTAAEHELRRLQALVPDIRWSLMSKEQKRAYHNFKAIQWRIEHPEEAAAHNRRHEQKRKTL